MADRHWPSQAYLDILRPDPGWYVEVALLTSYSADLVAVVAAMLALAGVDNDQGSGSKVDFANAFEHLRGRLKILVQAGRIALPSRRPPILSILDQFLEEVRQDETRGSWHPKIALIKLRTEDTAHSRWRLWIGSRNLTRSFDWDAGLSLSSDANGRGHHIEGVAELGATLAQRARLPHVSSDALYGELKALTWQLPFDVKAIHELRQMVSNRDRGLPSPPKQLRKLYVISPFIDARTVARLGKWGDEGTERFLLSLRPQLEAIHTQNSNSLLGFQQLLCMGIPDPDGMGATVGETADASDDEEPDIRGLHAKLIYAEHHTKHTLWLGSANASRRGWDGPNTEVVARLEISSALAQGLTAFVNAAQPIALDSLERTEVEDTVADRLSQARQQVSARWHVRQRRSDQGNWLEADELPHPADVDIVMSVGTLTGALVEWPRSSTRIQLHKARYSLDSDLVQIQLVLADENVAWLQSAPLDPPPDEDRDRRVLTHYLDPKTFLIWIRSLLFGDDIGDGGGDWREERVNRRSRYGGPSWWAPTLEEVLKTWSRNPEQLVEIDRKVTAYLDAIKESEVKTGDHEAYEVLSEFQTTWGVLRSALFEDQ